jgi:hypothetical protein
MPGALPYTYQIGPRKSTFYAAKSTFVPRTTLMTRVTVSSSDAQRLAGAMRAPISGDSMAGCRFVVFIRTPDV